MKYLLKQMSWRPSGCHTYLFLFVVKTIKSKRQGNSLIELMSLLRENDQFRPFSSQLKALLQIQRVSIAAQKESFTFCSPWMDFAEEQATIWLCRLQNYNTSWIYTLSVSYLKVKTLIGKEWDLEWSYCKFRQSWESGTPGFFEPPLLPAVTEETGFPLQQGPVITSRLACQDPPAPSVLTSTTRVRTCTGHEYK